MQSYEVTDEMMEQRRKLTAEIDTFLRQTRGWSPSIDDGTVTAIHRVRQDTWVCTSLSLGNPGPRGGQGMFHTVLYKLEWTTPRRSATENTTRQVRSRSERRQDMLVKAHKLSSVWLFVDVEEDVISISTPVDLRTSDPMRVVEIALEHHLAEINFMHIAHHVLLGSGGIRLQAFTREELEAGLIALRGQGKEDI